MLHVDREVSALLNASFLGLLHLLQQVLPLMRLCLLKGFRTEIWTRYVLLLWLRTIPRLFLEVIQLLVEHPHLSERQVSQRPPRFRRLVSAFEGHGLVLLTFVRAALLVGRIVLQG